MIKIQGHKVVKDFVYKGRRCVVIEIDRSGVKSKLPNSLQGTFEPYCNGYIELKDKEVLDDYDDYKITSDEITYQGDLKFPQGLDASNGKPYIGFDSAHYHNWEKPETRTADHIANICKKMVNELNTIK